MPRWFNTAGPCDPAKHYMLSPEARLPQVRQLIEQQAYFVLHAPRQVGKTTALLALAAALTREGHYVGVLVSAEVGAVFPDDPGAAELAILGAWRGAACHYLPDDLQPPRFPDAPAGTRIGAALQAWSEASPRPLIVFLDEIDALQNNALISVLRQLRDGYPKRPQGFPYALALIGLRDVRDYKVASGGSGRLGTASPFNIKSDSLTMRNFNREEVAALYTQHTEDTGQAFLPEATARAFELTQGQPWLVNALARQLVEVLVPDRKTPIALPDVERAKEILIERQDTHLDSLVERLREPRVRAVMEPMLAGRMLGDVPEDDRRFLLDLGLLRRTAEGGLDVANPIYKEVIVRALASGSRDSLPRITATWLTPDGGLDSEKLLAAFLDFWRRHGEALLGTAPYHEIAPHLVLMAFLHRVVNGGGSIEREYAIGRGRMDLCVTFKGQTLAIELKVWRDGRRDPLSEGLEQLDEYLGGLGLNAGWLIIFDQRSDLPPIAERTAREDHKTPSGRGAIVIRA